MNRQSQQLVVAGVVAFLTSGIITLAGLSAAQDMNMGGMPPPGGDGGMQQQYQPMDSGIQQQFQPMDSGIPQQFQQMDGYHPMDQRTPSLFQNTQQGHDVGGVKMDFQRDGANFQKDGAGFQRDGMNFQKDGAGFQRDGQNFRFGAPDFGGKTGTERGLHGDFGGKTEAEHEGGRFERKGGFDFGGNDEMKMKGKMQKMGGEFGSRFGGEEGGNALFEQWKKKGQEDRGISEEDLAEIDDVLADDESTITAEQALAYLKDATVEVKEFQGDLKDANKAVKELVTDDKKLGKLEAQVEKKYGDVEDAPPQVAAKVEDLATEVSGQKENLQGALAAIDGEIQESRERLEELKAELEDSDIKQAAALIKTCNTLLQKLDKVDTGFGKLEQKVEHVEVEAHA